MTRLNDCVLTKSIVYSSPSSSMHSSGSQLQGAVGTALCHGKQKGNKSTSLSTFIPKRSFESTTCSCQTAVSPIITLYKAAMTSAIWADSLTLFSDHQVFRAIPLSAVTFSCI
jgi:hypothetical protein